MSMATVMETYDTQMLDSGDADMTMYSGASPSWLSVEASMTDDALDAGPSTIDPDNQNIEVDMQDYEDGITEFEMADEQDQPGYEGEQDLLDVDFLDASRVQTPQLPQYSLGGDSIHNSDGLRIFEAKASSPTPVNSHSDPSAIPQINVETTPTPEHHTQNEAELSSSSEPPAATPELQSAEAVHLELQNEAPDAAVAHLSSLDAHAIPLPEGGSLESPPGTTRAMLATVQEHQSSGEGTSEVVSSTGEHRLDPSKALRKKELQEGEPTVNLREIERTAPVDGSEQNPDTDRGETTYEQTGEADAGSGDPHEISEGVYIDPPPAVLLSLQFASETVEYCLFNQPHHESGSRSPAGGRAATERELYTLLLHHRPTLYYEPLTAVFAALREDTSAQSLPNFAEGELILDAYDIQLAVSEDNVHAHDVTLHDLNVIHDGSDLHGPLRLQLRVVFPRFITRYHVLRDQIARLDLSAEDEDAYNVQYDEHDHGAEHAAASTTEEQSQHQVRHEQSVGSAETSDAPPHSNQQVEEIGHDEGTATHELQALTGNDTEFAPEEAIGDSSEFATHISQEPQDGEEPPFEEYQEEEGVTEEDELYEERLDADEIHRESDAGEGGEYTEPEHQVDLEEDDERFGEDLPEDLGGKQPADDGLQDDYYDGVGQSFAAVGEGDDAKYAEEDANESRERSAVHASGHEDSPQEKNSEHSGIDDPIITTLRPDLQTNVDNLATAETNYAATPPEYHEPLPEGDDGTSELFDVVSTTANDVDETAPQPDLEPLEDEDWDESTLALADVDAHVVVTESSDTLASKKAKRRHDEIELDDIGTLSAEDGDTSSPGKRPRHE